jgi:hypothetical protein
MLQRKRQTKCQTALDATFLRQHGANEWLLNDLQQPGEEGRRCGAKITTS